MIVDVLGRAVGVLEGQDFFLRELGLFSFANMCLKLS